MKSLITSLQTCNVLDDALVETTKNTAHVAMEEKLALVETEKFQLKVTLDATQAENVIQRLGRPDVDDVKHKPKHVKKAKDVNKAKKVKEEIAKFVSTGMSGLAQS